VANSHLEMAREWNIEHSGVQTNHQMVSVQLAPLSTPKIGKGRSTFPLSVLSHDQVVIQLLRMGKKLRSSLNLLNKEKRTNENNPQTLWETFKQEVLDFGNRRAKACHKRACTNLHKWQKCRLETLWGIDSMSKVEFTLQLDKVDSAIKHLTTLKAQCMRDKIAAHHYLEGETNSKYNYRLNQLKAPRDTIVSLQTNPGSLPAVYSSDSKEMTEIAPRFYDTLQDMDEHVLPSDTIQA
jgi:hypothetical protein